MGRLLVVGATALGALGLCSCIYTDRRLEGRSCQHDRDCLDGYACVQRRCVDEGAVADSGPADAGAPDADSGDRAVVDAEPRDVVTADTVATDASAPDVSSADSPALDMGSPDAASTDTSVLDASGTTDGASAADTQREDSPSGEDAPVFCGAVGHTCEIPPSAMCIGAVLRTYSGPGDCISDMCVFPSTDTTCAVACDVDHCTLCGNGANDGEDCDDGNRVSGDGCSSLCAVETGWTCTAQPPTCTPICGDSIVVGPELCDDGSADTGGCDFADGAGPHACTPAICGDGYANTAAGEPCDDGSADSGDCNYAGGSGVHACTYATCGDGYHNAAAAEDCDDANSDQTDSCLNTCEAASCGDGFVQVGESCDDHNTLACGTCSADCSTVQGTASNCASGVGCVAAVDCLSGQCTTDQCQ